MPKDRIIDGKDILPLLTDDGAKSPHDAFFYFANYALEGVRQGKWKLRLVDHAPLKGGEPKREGISLYDLEKDLGETTNVAAAHPDVVVRLQTLLDGCRAVLGDGAKNPGPGRRAPGKVGNGPPRAG